jgi:hypothetical protein
VESRKLAGDRSGIERQRCEHGGVDFIQSSLCEKPAVFWRAIKLNLGLDRGLVYDRPHLNDLILLKLIDHVLGKEHFFAVYGKIEEFSSRRAIEANSARDVGRVGDQDLNIEEQVRNFFEILLQHLEIAGKPDLPIVTYHIVMNEMAQFWPILFVEAGNVTSVDTAKTGIAHSLAPILFHADIQKARHPALRICTGTDL